MTWILSLQDTRTVLNMSIMGYIDDSISLLIFLLPWHFEGHSHATTLLLWLRFDNLVPVLIKSSLSILILEFLNVVLAVVAAGVWLEHLGNLMSLLVKHPDSIALLAHESIGDALLHVIWFHFTVRELDLVLGKQFLVLLILLLVVFVEFGFH